LEELLTSIEANPPIFRPSRELPDFFQLQPTRTPLFGHLATRFILEVNGQQETLIRLIPLYGESRVFLLLSSRLYRFSQAEFLLLDALSKIFHRHPSVVTKTHFVSYPEPYMIHRRLVAVDSRQVATFGNITRPYSFIRLIARARSSEDSVLAPQPDFPDDLLLKWAIGGSDGNRNNFLYCRQSIASHYAAFSYLEMLFGSAIRFVPPLLFSVDRQRVFYPGILQGMGGIAFPPLTNQVRRYLPDFVLKGTFSATWLAAANSLGRNIHKVRVLIEAFLPEQRQALGVVERIERMMVVMGKDTDKDESVWGFDLLDHLIECAGQATKVDCTRIAWI
jgi:hypothetical protein